MEYHIGMGQCGQMKILKNILKKKTRKNKKGGGIVSLTSKQEKFIQALVAGKSQRQAYKEAYNAANMKDKTIDERASVLFKNDKIKTRYNELLEEHKNKALYTREEAVNDLIWIKEKSKEDILKNGIRQANSTTYVNSIKELSTLNDLYPDKKNKTTEDGDFAIKIIKASEQDEA